MYLSMYYSIKVVDLGTGGGCSIIIKPKKVVIFCLLIYYAMFIASTLYHIALKSKESVKYNLT